MAMHRGDRGPGVGQMQRQLHKWIQGVHEQGGKTGLIGVIADDSFGPNTQVALAAYQKAIGVSPTGYADSYTLETLGLDGRTEANSIYSESGESL